MPVLARAKRQAGTRSITADSQQTMACVYLSAIVLVGLSLNALFGWWWADPAAALLVALAALVMFGLAWAKHRIAVKPDNDPLAAEARLSFLDGLLASGILPALVLTAVCSSTSEVYWTGNS